MDKSKQGKAPVKAGNPGVVTGDRIYCRHPKLGPISAEVTSVGRDGVTIPHESGKGHIGVKWDAVLGHHTRRERKLRLIEHGEDGFIARDEDGQRVYVQGGVAQPTVDADDPDQEDAGPALHKALLLDLGPLSCSCTDTALEHMHKALSEDGIQDWAQHESPFIRSLIDNFIRQGMLRVDSVRDELSAWIAGERHIPGLGRSRSPVPVPGVWTERQVGMVRTYLEALSPAQFRLEDWALLIDFLAQRYLPVGQLRAEAEMLVARSAMMGFVEAHLETLADATALQMIEAMPTTVAAAAQTFAFSDVSVSIMQYGSLRACDAVTAVSEALRLGLRRTILEHQQRRLAGDPEATSVALQQALFDRYGQCNRDWRMIAVTEAGEMCNQGVIAALPPDSLVRRMEQYHGACPFCRELDGRVFRVTTADDPKKDGYKDVWPGKTNIGRSASPRKRVGDELVPRLPHERWWAAAGTQHPHCRGRWEPLKRLEPGQDPAFAKWMMQRAGVRFGMPPPDMPGAAK